MEDHGGATVDMPLSKIHFKYPLPINKDQNDAQGCPPLITFQY